MRPGPCLRSLLLAAGVLAAGCSRSPAAGRLSEDRPPRLDPDYVGVTIPPNIAPLNCVVDETGEAFQLHLEAPGGQAVHLQGERPELRLPPRRWRRLLEAARGASLTWRIAARQPDGSWRDFAPFVTPVAADPVDPVLVYRRFHPLYSKYVNMGIYQRELEGFSETAVLHSRTVGKACLNCHTFRAGDPRWFALQTRGDHGLTMLLAHHGQVESIDTRTAFNRSPAAYTAWHPGGEYVAFSVNKVSLFYHTRGETRDVFDSASDLALYRVADGVLTTSAAVSRPDSLETWPHWAPDGRQLYFARAPALPVEEYAAVRYDLMRVSFDPEQGAFGPVETVLASAATGLSITQPQVSPDGRFVVVTMAAYGNFPVFLSSADLYLLDLRRGGWRPLESNSERTDSWHSWSSNSRWLVFSSKRRDGLFARPHLAYIDTAGRAARPFVVPQEDPAFYRACMETFNVPELAQGRVPVPAYRLAEALRDTAAIQAARLDPRVTGTGPVSSVEAPEPYTSGRRP